MKLITSTILCAAITVVPAFAQSTAPKATPATATKAPAASAASKTADTNLAIFLDKIKADKKLLVAANMGLTDAEGKIFWPVYDMYQTELKAINDRLSTAIHAYADAYTKNTLTDAQATKLANDVLTIDSDEIAMRKKYATTLAATALPGKKAARYLQIETKIRAALRAEMADAIPLVQ